MHGDIVTQGFQLMLYGMGTVIVFLTLLVFATGAMSTIVARFFPEATPRPQPPAAPRPAAPAGEGELVAVISAAIRRHRQRRDSR